MRQYELLYDLKNAKSDQKRVEAYRSLMRILASEVMVTWRIIKNVVSPLLEELRLTFDQVAYLNLIKFRTEGRALKRTLYDRAWPLTAEQLDVLEPALVVALGSGVSKELQRRYQGSTDFITRSIGDRSLPPQGRSDIQRIGTKFGSLVIQKT